MLWRWKRVSVEIVERFKIGIGTSKLNDPLMFHRELNGDSKRQDSLMETR